MLQCADISDYNGETLVFRIFRKMVVFIVFIICIILFERWNLLSLSSRIITSTSDEFSDRYFVRNSRAERNEKIEMKIRFSNLTSNFIYSPRAIFVNLLTGNFAAIHLCRVGADFATSR